MTGPELNRPTLFILECLVETGSAFRGCEQRRFGLLQQLQVVIRDRSDIDLGLGALLCEHCSQICAMLSQKHHF
jgi:hypothetical protein